MKIYFSRLLSKSSGYNHLFIDQKLNPFKEKIEMEVEVLSEFIQVIHINAQRINQLFAVRNK